MKIKNNKKHVNAKATGKFKSTLEATCARLLTEEGLNFQYEPFSITLVPKFTHSFES